MDAGNQPLQAIHVSRRLSVVAGFYRTCVIDGVLEHRHRPTMYAGHGSHRVATLGLTHLQFEAMFTAARRSANLNDFALVAMLGLLGLRIFEHRADITSSREMHGHRVLHVHGKGDKITRPVAARRRPGDRPSRDGRNRGRSCAHTGGRMDRHAPPVASAPWPAAGVAPADAPAHAAPHLCDHHARRRRRPPRRPDRRPARRPAHHHALRPARNNSTGTPTTSWPPHGLRDLKRIQRSCRGHVRTGPSLPLPERSTCPQIQRWAISNYDCRRDGVADVAERWLADFTPDGLPPARWACGDHGAVTLDIAAEKISANV